MAVGSRTFTTEGREVKKFESTPPAPGEYEGMLRCANWKIGVAAGAGKLPYLSGPIELLNTASSEGGKNRVMFHRFFLDLTPAKDGTPMVDRANQITGFSRGVGTPMTGVNIDTKKKAQKDESGQETGELMDADCLNAQEALDWLQQFDGVVFKLRTKIEKGTQGYPDKGAVDYFIETEEQVTQSSDDSLDDELPAPTKLTPAKASKPAAKVAGKKR